MALQWVQETILSAETVPWLTTTSQDPNSEQVVGKGFPSLSPFLPP